MVTQTNEGMSACADFKQNAWKPDLCANCQRPQGEHGQSNENAENLEIHQIQVKTSSIDSPKPAKRNSLMTKSMTVSHDGQSEDEEERWNAMCLPDPDHADHALDVDRIPAMRMLYTERVYEEIGEGSSSQGDSTNRAKTIQTSGSHHQPSDRNIDQRNLKESKTDNLADTGTENSSPKVNKVKRSSVDITGGQRSRSSSRDKSPAPAPKPKLTEKPVTQKSNKSVMNANIPITSATTRKLTSELSKDNKVDLESDRSSPSAINRKMKKSSSKVSFTDTDPVVIGTDGGYDNLFLDHEDGVADTDDDVKEILKFSENEKEWALLALKNTIKNSEIGPSNERGINKLRISQSKEFEDVELEYLWKPDRFAQVRDCPKFPTQQVYGTFPLRTKSGKSGLESYFDGGHLSSFSESTESTALEPIEELNEKYEAFIRLGNMELNSKKPKPEKVKQELNCSEDSDPNYDDPWEGKFGFDTNSEMNLLDEIRGEIDLDSSSAGMALVDMLNDVLAKYSTGTPSETDSVLNFDFLEEEKSTDPENKPTKKERKEKQTELEAKMVSLAVSLRKKQAKGKAPRPPSCPPEPPNQSPSVSPAKTAEMRAAQSKEPTFKMVPLGKAIGSATLPPAQSDSLKSLEQDFDAETMEVYKIKMEKKEQKKGGGISSFFSRFLRRGRDSESDLTVSSETIVSNSGSQSEAQSDSDSLSDRGSYSDRKGEKGDNLNKRTSKYSPQMKLKVLPTKPLSPKPQEKQSQNVLSKSAGDKPNSPKLPRSKPNKSSSDKLNEFKDINENSDSNPESKKSSPKTSKSKEDLVHSKIDHSEASPTKSVDTVEPRIRAQSPSPKSKEAPPLPVTGPRELADTAGAVPRPRVRGSSDGGARSRPRTRDFSDKPRDIPTGPPPKPPVAAKPKNPVTQTKSVDSTDGSHSSPTRDRFASSSSLDEETPPTKITARGSRDSRKNIDPKLLRKRAKSPKRFAAPIPPCRASLPNLLSDSVSSLPDNTSDANTGTSQIVKTESKGLAFAKELEIKLSKDHNRDHNPAAEARKMSAAPPPPPSPTAKTETSEKSKTLPASKPSSKNKETLKTASSDSKLSQKEVPKSTSKEDTTLSPPQDETKQKSPTTEAESPELAARMIEKIELPRSAGNSRKSFLGKLNRKNRPPPPPSVKRTKSISEASRDGEQLHLKKIDLKDISGPVLITDMATNKIVRRNTITIGDDNAFLSGGSTSSGSASIGEKSDLSPHGSLENLYELITPESPAPAPGSAPGDRKNFYDPVDESNKVLLLRPVSMTGSEGYLEPIKTNGGTVLEFGNHLLEPTPVVTMTTSIAATATSASHSMESVNVLNDDIDVTPITEIDPVDDFELTDERKQLIAAQPIYEEINGYGKLGTSNNTNLESVNSNPPFKTESHTHNVPNSENHSVENGEQLSLPTSTLKSKDSFSSESDLSSANSSLSRGPRPMPRRRPRQSFGSTIEQYVAMNRPSAAVFLNEDQLRETLKVLTAMTLHTLRDIYTQHEKCFTKENVHIGATGPLKWHDFDIYGKPIHTSERCIAYNAKLKPGLNPCQVMLLHSRPEITPANHPSLLKPTCIFTDAIPVSYLTEDFVKTSQLLHTFVDQSNSSKCYIAVGLFDITESLTNHLNSLESACESQKNFLTKGLFFLLQLLSAISHCIEQGHPLAEADFRDVYLITNPYCLGETVSFLPQLRSPENQQIDTVCMFLEKFLEDTCVKCDATSVLDDSAFFTYNGVQRIMSLLQARTTECLPIVRSYTEYILWGPEEGDLTFIDDRTSNVEPKLSIWLEKQRAELIHGFATHVQHGARYQITDFYRLKFLLKASSGSLSECLRCHASS